MPDIKFLVIRKTNLKGCNELEDAVYTVRCFQSAEEAQSFYVELVNESGQVGIDRFIYMIRLNFNEIDPLILHMKYRDGNISYEPHTRESIEFDCPDNIIDDIEMRKLG